MPLCSPTPSDPFNLFSISWLFFSPAANIKCFFLMRFISFSPLCCLPHLCVRPPPPSFWFALSLYLQVIPLPPNRFFRTSICILFRLLSPTLSSLSSRLFLCAGWFLLRSDSLLINNAQETGCFYNTDIALLLPTPPRNLFLPLLARKKKI